MSAIKRVIVLALAFAVAACTEVGNPVPTDPVQVETVEPSGAPPSLEPSVLESIIEGTEADGGAGP